MKTEKICISKKNLIISLIVIFLLGVVGVSYMVQKNISVKSRAEDTQAGATGSCDAFFDQKMEQLYKGYYGEKAEYKVEKGGPQLAYEREIKKFLDDSLMTPFRKGIPGDGCPQDYIGSMSTLMEVPMDLSKLKNDPLNTSLDDVSRVGGRACCLRKEVSGEKVTDALNKFSLEYRDGNGLAFYNKETSNDAKASTIVNTCVNYGAAGNPTRSCGPNVEFKESCDGGIRTVHVACENKSTPEQVPGNNSCGFTCKTANKNAKGEDVFAYECDKPTTCLVPSPTPTEPPTANTFNSTNQTSNQAGTEVNVKCSTNLKQQDGSILKSDYYKCYVAIDLLRGTTINENGDIFPAPTKINSIPVVYESNDANRALPRRVSTFYSQNKNEPCKKLVGNTLTNGVCASVK